MWIATLSVVAGACSDGASSAWRGEGTVEMAERLARIATEVEPREHPYIGQMRLDSLLTVAPPADALERVTLEARIGREAMRVGRNDDAIARFESLIAEFPSLQGQVPPGTRIAIVESLGLAHLRAWEREHCVSVARIEPCLFPPEATGPHDARHADAAAAVYLALAQSQPGSLTSRWLLNLAHMMIGDYPDAVPEALRIPADLIAGEFEAARFPDVAPALGLDVAGHAGGGIMDDFDGDGDLDIVASSWHLRDQLRFFRNDGDGGFTDATMAAGLEGITGGLNLAHADFNNDGALDILVLRGAWTAYGEPNSLLRNNGDGTFEDVTEAAGLLSPFPTQTGAWGDFDNDGWLDLYIGNESQGTRAIANQLFRNNQDGTFSDVAEESGVAAMGFVKGVAWGDIDNDGWLDLYVSRLLETNLLFRNDGPGADGRPTFSDVTTESGVAEPIASFPTWFWDYDNDGWLDLFVSGYQGTPGDVAADYLGTPHQGEPPRLYRNLGDGTFADVAAEIGLDHVLLTMGSNFGDLDGDGFEDFYAGTGEANLQTIVPNRMFRNDAGSRFQDVTTPGGFGHLGKGHGVSYGDLDHDGDQDIYVTMGGAFEGDLARNVLFENPGNANRWITLQVEGLRSNRSAIGARIRVVTASPNGTVELHRVVGTGSSFGANSLVQEIGLGQATRIDLVEITWPTTGRTDRFTEVSLDRAYRIREGDDAMAPWTRVPFQLGDGARGQP